jgi:hypothetical protein
MNAIIIELGRRKLGGKEHNEVIRTGCLRTEDLHRKVLTDYFRIKQRITLCKSLLK